MKGLCRGIQYLFKIASDSFSMLAMFIGGPRYGSNFNIMSTMYRGTLSSNKDRAAGRGFEAAEESLRS